MGKLGR
jgi:hypothetical protein